jgi:DNA-binding transcriptional ArsR family regulator
VGPESRRLFSVASGSHRKNPISLRSRTALARVRSGSLVTAVTASFAATKLTALQVRPFASPIGRFHGMTAAALGSHLRPSLLTVLPALTILRHMVKFQGSQLDRTFVALVDPTRRAILARLEQEGSVSIGELTRPFAIKLPAVMKHLDVLGTAGLITRSKKGRTVAVRLAPEPMKEAMDWLRRYERFWSARLDRLAAYVEAEEAKAGSMKTPEDAP